MPPGWMLEVGKQSREFFEAHSSQGTGRKPYRLKSIEVYSREHNTQEQPSKKYFKGTTLTEIIQGANSSKGEIHPNGKDIEI
jgi:dual specificity protein kinase YAK1